MYAVCNHHCNHLIITVTVTVTVKIIRHQAQKMCQTLIMLPLFRNHHLNVAYPTVFYRCVIIPPFYIHQIIRCIKHKVQLYRQNHWCVKLQHQCIIIWRLLTQHRRCSCSHRTQMDRLVIDVWEHRHHLDSCHASITAVIVTQVLTLLQNQMIIGN